jgi:hypothetical protein
MSKTLRPQIGEKELIYMERAMEIGGYSNATEFVNAAIIIAYKHLVDTQLQKAGEWENDNWERIQRQAHEMQALQLQDEKDHVPTKEVVLG